MRVLFVLPYVPSLIRVRPYHFLRELSRYHEVSILALAMKSELAHAGALRAFCRQVEVIPFHLAEGLGHTAVGVLRGQPLQSTVCQSAALERRLETLLAQQAFDVVHVEHLRAAWTLRSLAGRVPLVYDSVDSISLLQERTLRASHSPRQRLLAALELHRTRTYEALTLRLADQVVVTSPVDGDALRALAPTAQVSVIPNGVDLEYFSPASHVREPATLVFSGKMSYHANASAVQHFVRHILPLVRQSCPGARLRIVGSSPPPAVWALAADPAIEVTGYLPDIRPALASGTVAICPMTVKVGMQNKILEAMAMGLPVVASREGSEGLNARSGQEILVASTAEDFAGQVSRLLADKDQQRRVGEAGRRFVETHHRWELAARQLEAVYDEARATARGRDYGAGTRLAEPALGSPAGQRQPCAGPS